jgi:diacylglycerol kinase (ATP)
MKYLLIINPTSGKGIYKSLITKAEKAFSCCNLSSTGQKNYHEHILKIKITAKRGDAVSFAKATNADVVIAAGGDGTVNEVINGIMMNNLHGTKKPRLAVIPLGTSNMVARSLNVPKNIDKALQIILSNRRKDLDIGKVNQRYFSIGCGVGLDAMMYKNVEPKIKKLFGEVAYPLSFIKTVFNYNPELLEVHVDGQAFTGYYVLVCNITQFHHLFRLVKCSRDDDGLFDVLIFKKKEIGHIFRYVLGVAAQQAHNLKDLHCLKASELRITSKKKVIAHADAEIIGGTPVTVKMYKKAIEVVC